MASNQYFHFFNKASEQNLIENLIVESLRIYAHDMLYLPKNGVNKDDILNEYKYNTFDTTIPIELYVKSFASFEGDGQFLGKFGLEIRDQMTLTMAKRSFNQFVNPVTNEIRPLEGDCIYIPMLEALFEIKYVDPTASGFYQLGALQTWDLNVELYEASGDKFNTGLSYIDDPYNSYGYDKNSLEFGITDEDDNLINDTNGINIVSEEYDIEQIDSIARNDIFEKESKEILDFSEKNPFDSLYKE